ncbi:MAG: HD domain-containing protein [Spirosomataceae bacterium]
MMNKRKILNDPVYGFITIPNELLFDLIEHPYFQRLRRIKQLGMAELVYPGALHTRFHHALGAMHLMGQALQNLQSKGHEISEQEIEAACIAILLHDVGHGPFSHVLEHTILDHVPHEKISLLLMQELNRHFGGALDLAIRMFANQYERSFFHQLISSQLDIDRLDYLTRDCFFTGVAEGSIGADRIIKMLNVHQNQLVVEEKGIYSIENFLTARRLMYWQVYLHKTSICAETMLIQIMRRAKDLALHGETVFDTPALHYFLTNNLSLDDFKKNKTYLQAFTQLDDYDIWACVKMWALHPDPILSTLSRLLLERKLYKIIFSTTRIERGIVDELKGNLLDSTQVSRSELSYLLVEGNTTNSAYMAGKQKIHILTKSGEIKDIAEASDLPTVKALSKIVKKYYVCWAKDISLR